MADSKATDQPVSSVPARRRLPDVVPIPPPDREYGNKPEPELIDAAARKVHPNWFVRVLSSRRFWVIFAFVILIAAWIEIPHLYWMIAPELGLKVTVVDKTVPFPDYREHRGLFWLLDQNKFIDTSRDATQHFYDYKYDYVGCDPVKPPEQLRTTLLLEDSLADRDVLYLADTYGVYRSDYRDSKSDPAAELLPPPPAPAEGDTGTVGAEPTTGDSGTEPAAMTEPPAPLPDMCFGGLLESEVSAIEQFAAANKLIIGEFNCFASPTEGELRQRMENVFGVTWTGWIGRYIAGLQNETDVPPWLRLRYEETEHTPWPYKGPGYILLHHETGEFIVLEMKTDVEERGLELTPREDYIKQDVMQGVRTCTFANWFDIVEPQAGTEVLADYTFHLTTDGIAKLAAHDLPLTFPAILVKLAEFSPFVPAATDAQTADAVGNPADETEAPSHVVADTLPPRSREVRSSTEYCAYYLAGDMVDYDDAMGPPETRLTMYINRSYFGRPVVGSHGYFFWHTYYPLISNVLREECNRLNRGIPRNIYLFD